jgi:4-amino-4-deoxy-L-arabinose transferase-like glycosyltransferase
MYEYDTTARQYVQGNFTFVSRKSLPTSTFYPYFLALLYKVSGNSQRFAKVSQAIISSLTVVLLYFVAMRYMRRPIAVICALALALYGVLIYYSSLLLPETVILFFFVLMLWFAGAYERTRRNVFAVLAGLALGLCAVARPNNILVVPFIVAWFLVLDRPVPTRKWAVAALFLLAVLTGPALWGLKNFALGIERRPDFSIGLFGVLIGNTYDSMGIFYYCPESANSIFAASGGSSIRGIAELLKGIGRHPTQWLIAEAGKVAAFWIGFEPANNVSYYESRELSSLLRLPLPGFALASAAGLLGMATCLKRAREFSLLYLTAAGLFFSVVVFFILARYRLPIVPVLLLFGGLALEETWQCIHTRRYLRTACLAAAGAALLVATRSANIRLVYPAPYLQTFDSIAKHNVAIAYIEKGQYRLGEAQLKRVIEADPLFSPAYVTYAMFCQTQGRNMEALALVGEGLRLAPSDRKLLVTREYLVSGAQQ